MKNNKSRGLFGSIVFLVAFFVAFSFVFIFADGANADSTIGVNIETTNTASAGYFLTSQTIQVGGGASVAYNRFGTGTTTHAGSITTTNDLLISGDFEVNGSAAFDGKAYFGSAASISGVLELADGQFRPQADATTAFRFQNAAADTSILVIDTTNGWVGIGTTPTTDFEVQGTASASYFLTTNAVQFGGGTATVAYSRFGTATTTHAGSIGASNDLLISGDFEVNGSAAFDGKAYFGSAASISGVLELADGQFRPQADATTAFRFQNAAGSTSVLVIDTTNTRVGVGKTPDTTFDVSGSASVSVNFEVIQTASLSTAKVLNTLLVGANAASSSTAYRAQFASTATTSILFSTTDTAKGACFQLRDMSGRWVFARIDGGNSWVINTTSCR